MSNRQFELFDRRNSAQVIPFPNDRLQGKARHVADVVMSKKSVSAVNSYWQTPVLKHFIARLESLSLDKARIDDELREIHYVVCLELSRRGWFKSVRQQNGPNDAA